MSLISNLVKKKSIKEHDCQARSANMTQDKILQMKKDAKRDEYGKYIIDKTKPIGSIDNPSVVGMPDSSDNLQYDLINNRWILTDGL